MSKSLAAIIETGDDSSVTSAVYSRLVDRYGPTVDVSSIPEEHRTVLLVEYTSGAIGNGGFASFFGAELPGDPDYQFMLAAYRAIGCEPAVTALGKVLDAVVDDQSPGDDRERVIRFVRANRDSEGRLQTDFFKTLELLPAALTQYIRHHQNAFASLDTLPKRTTESRLEPRRTDPTAVGLRDLPRWARVAFVARSMRLVLPLYREAWPAAPSNYIEGLETAVRLAEISAAQAHPTGDLNRAQSDAGIAAGAPMVLQFGYPVYEEEDPPEDPDAAHTASLVANAVRHAAQTAMGNDEALRAYGFAKEAAGTAGRDDVLEQMQRDFRRLRSLVRKAGFTNSSPVPPDAFEPGYEPPAKPWWKFW